jgi:hypothetical protein
LLGGILSARDALSGEVDDDGAHAGTFSGLAM